MSDATEKSVRRQAAKRLKRQGRGPADAIRRAREEARTTHDPKSPTFGAKSGKQIHAARVRKETRDIKEKESRRRQHGGQKFLSITEARRQEIVRELEGNC